MNSFHIKTSVKFEGEVPPRHGRFGLMVHGTLINEWLDHCQPFKWCDVDLHAHDSANSEQGGKVQLVFDGMTNATPVKVDIKDSVVCAYDRHQTDSMNGFVSQELANNETADDDVVNEEPTVDDDGAVADLDA